MPALDAMQAAGVLPVGRQKMQILGECGLWPGQGSREAADSLPLVLGTMYIGSLTRSFRDDILVRGETGSPVGEIEQSRRESMGGA